MRDSASKLKLLLVIGISGLALQAFQNCGKSSPIDMMSASKFDDPTTEIPDHWGKKKEGKASLQHSPIGNRYYIASVLNDIFLPAGTSLTVEQENEIKFIQNTIQNYIGRRGDTFSGACNPTDRSNECQRATALRATEHFAQASVSRSTLVAYTCEKLLHKDYSVEYVLTHLETHQEESVEGLPLTTPDHVQQVVDMFYLGHEMGSEVTQSLLDLSAEVQKEDGLLNAWRAIILTVCTSPGWQTY